MAERKLIKHWILVRNKTSSIFNKPYTSLDETKRDLATLNSRSPGHGYVLEERESWQQVDF